MSFKLNSSFFYKVGTNVLCLVVTPDRLGILTKATDTIRRLKNPSNVPELKFFLGLCNKFRHSVQSFARIASPPECKLEKDQLFQLRQLNKPKIKGLATLQH